MTVFTSLPRRLRTGATFLACALFCAFADAADIIKDSNTSALNLGTSWVGGTGPGAGDIAVWDSTISAGNSSALSADVSWGGIKVTNVGGTRNNGSGTNSIFITGSGSQLTLGTSGIDLSTATQAIQIQSKILLGGNQSWTIANANSVASPFGAAFNEDLYFAALTTGTAMNFGGFTASTSGAGSIVITNGYSLSNGTLTVDNAGGLLIQSGSSRKTTLGSDFTLNVSSGRTLVFKANSGTSGIGVDSAAAVNLTGATLKVESSNTTQINQTGKLTMSTGSTLDNTYSTVSANSRMLLSGGVEVIGTNTWKESGAGTTATIFNSALTGSGTLNFQNTTTTRRADWSGDNSAFTGTVNINGASGNRNLRLTTASAGSASATWAPAAGNILEVDGVAVNLGTLNGAGTVTNSHATNVAAISVGAGTFSGAITNGTPANGMSLTKVGAGTLTLSGNGNTFTGNTLISGGKLVATQTGALSTSSAISVNGSGAIFDGTGSFGAVTVADGLGTVQNGNGTSGALTFSSLTFDGDATLNIVTSSSTPTARVVVSGALATTPANGQVIVNGSGSWTNGVNNLVNFGSFGGALSDFTLGSITGLTARQSAGSLSLSGSDLFITVSGDSPKWTGLDSGNWVVGTTGASGNWKLITGGGQTDFIANDIVLFDDTALGTKSVNISAANVSVASAEFNNSSSNYTLTSSGGFGISAGTLTKNGTGSLTIENANTTSGGVLLNAGTLNVNHTNALGSGAITIGAGTTLNNTSGSAVTATNAQNWNGDFTFTGSNDLTLGTATMNASRQVTVAAGTLSVGGITGTGFGLTKEGAGTLAIGASTYTGATTLNAGTLKATSTTSFSTTSSVTLANAAGVALDLNGNNQTISTLSGGGTTGGDILLNGAVLTTGAATNTTFAGDLVGAGGLTKTGAGIFTLTGDKSGYTGTTTVSAGTLDLDTINGHFGPSVTVTAGTANNSIVVGGGLFVQGNGTLNTGISGGSAGFGARGGDLTVNVGGAGASISLNSSGTGGLGQMIFGSTASDSKVIVQNAVNLNNFNGTRTVTVNQGTGTASAEITGVISNANSGLVKAGTGTLILSGTNTYGTAITSGISTTINAGTLQIGNGTDAGSIAGSLGIVNNSALVYNVGSGNRTQANLISGSGTVEQKGTGTITFTAANTYSGGTALTNGTILVNNASGSGLGSGSVSVASGATLGGAGSVTLTGSNTITINGALTVGSPTDLAAVDLDLSTIAGSGSTILGNNSSVFLDIFSGAGHGATIDNSHADLLRLFGDLSIGTGVILTLGNPNNIATGSWADGDIFQLFDWTNLATRTGSFDSVDYTALNLPSGWSLNTSDLYSLGHVSIVGAVPEPSRALLLLIGGASLVLRRRRSPRAAIF